MRTTIDSISPKYKDILSRTEPYILSFPGNWERFDLSPWGLEIPKQNLFSCVSAKNADFFNLLHRLDGIAFGPKGMPMEKWVFYDCGEMPGGIAGFGVRAESLSDSALNEFKVDRHYKGLIPISMYVSIPMATPGAWFGHNLSSANRVLNPQLPGMGLFTKVLACKVFNIETFFGATQWDSQALHIHLQMANMKIISSYTPAHTFNNTLTYASTYDNDVYLNSLSGQSRKAEKWDFLYPSDDESFSIQIQERIENGEKFEIVGRPVMENNKPFYPVIKIN